MHTYFHTCFFTVSYNTPGLDFGCRIDLWPQYPATALAHSVPVDACRYRERKKAKTDELQSAANELHDKVRELSIVNAEKKQLRVWQQHMIMPEHCAGPKLCLFSLFLLFSPHAHLSEPSFKHNSPCITSFDQSLSNHVSLAV